MTTDIAQMIDHQVRKSRIMQEAAKAEGRVVEPPHGPTIVISRQLGSGGKLVAQRLAERLDFALWDKNLVDAIANDAYVSRRLVESLDEKTISEIDLLARTIAGHPEAGGFLYKRHLARALLAISKHGNAVIVGRGANFLLPDALSVRVVASESLRIRNLMEYEGVTEEDARRLIRESDHERAAFVRSVYNRDVEDLYAYDLIAVTDCFGVEGVAEIVLTALQRRIDACWRPKKK